jgi:hypothetical protein
MKNVVPTGMLSPGTTNGSPLLSITTRTTGTVDVVVLRVVLVVLDDVLLVVDDVASEHPSIATAGPWDAPVSSSGTSGTPSTLYGSVSRSRVPGKVAPNTGPDTLVPPSIDPDHNPNQ